MKLPNQMVGFNQNKSIKQIRIGVNSSQVNGRSLMRINRLGTSKRHRLNYQCDSTTGDCICLGVRDCLDMLDSPVCGGPIVCNDTSCVCEWKK